MTFNKKNKEYILSLFLQYIYYYSKEIRPLCIFFPGISIYKRYSDKTINICIL